LLPLVSVSSRGIAGNWPFGCDKVGTAGSNVAPRSGFSVLRYRSHQLVSTLSCKRFVSRFPILIRVDARRDTAPQRGKWTQINGGRAQDLRQVRVEERHVAELVIGVVVDILRHVPIEDLQRGGVEPVSTSPGTSLSWMPPSSLYCSHRSLSMISIAARNRRMSTSPVVMLLLLARATASDPLANSPAPTVPAPTTSPVRKKERRLVAAPNWAAPDWCDVFAIASSFCVWPNPSSGTRTCGVLRTHPNARERWALSHTSPIPLPYLSHTSPIPLPRRCDARAGPCLASSVPGYSLPVARRAACVGLPVVLQPGEVTLNMGLHRRKGGVEALSLCGDHANELAATGHQGGQLLSLGVRQEARRGVNDLGEVGGRQRVQDISLGQ
jgi:hypothetical protein